MAQNIISVHLATLVVLFFLKVAASAEPEGMGTKHSTDLCDDITDFSPIDPVRINVGSVRLSSRNNITFRSSIHGDPVCAVGVGDVAFETHGSRSDWSGLPVSWQNNNDDDSGSNSLTGTLQVEIYETNYNIYDTYALEITDNSNWGGECTCPNGNKLNVAVRLPNKWACDSSTKIQCFGGTGTVSCSQSNKFKNKVGYCGSPDAKSTIEVDEIFGKLDLLTTPARIVKGGAIEGKKTNVG
jgi:hypothetical protein